MTTIPPIGLRLFNGTCNSIITQTMELPVTFPTGEVLTLTFYVTPLNSSCSVVLGYNWLQQYNPLVDWNLGHISFCSTLHRGPAPSTISGESAILLSDPTPPSLSLTVEPLLEELLLEPLLSAEPSHSGVKPPHILFINVATYQRACKLQGSQVFQLSLDRKSVV